MDGIDRTSTTYLLKKSLLRKAWDGQLEKKNSGGPNKKKEFITGQEMISMILNIKKRVHDPEEHQRAVNRVNAWKQEALAEAQETKKDIREHAEMRAATGQEDKDPPELQHYIEEEALAEARLHQYLREMGTPAHLMPKCQTPGMLRLNAIESMNGSSKRWFVQEERDKLESALRRIPLTNQQVIILPPTIH
ncbi:MAG TPA: hypothetical protein VIF12_05585 [Micavibrio sp.]|jgi:hypothetical protein